jgi:hypothetical protein
VSAKTEAIDVVRLNNVRDRKREKRDNPMFTGVRVEESDFVGAVRVRERDLAFGDGEEAVT